MVCVVGRIRDLILQLSKSSIYSTKPKIAALQQAQAARKVSEAFPPAFLLTTIMALSTAWSALSPFGVFCSDVPAGDIRKMLQQMIEIMIRPE
ncbi:hypothetical protein [Klebsiella pneumoniae]|uniref:hypothetical protein n=1 Tax=Klebsiella pneumoniae TaxID=573 RepID=UPI0007CCFBC5|nr:Uncharacterised protein [Klebsiella pneumoniae]